MTQDRCSGFQIVTASIESSVAVLLEHVRPRKDQIGTGQQLIVEMDQWFKMDTAGGKQYILFYLFLTIEVSNINKFTLLASLVLWKATAQLLNWGTNTHAMGPSLHLVMDIGIAGAEIIILCMACFKGPLGSFGIQRSRNLMFPCSVEIGVFISSCAG